MFSLLFGNIDVFASMYIEPYLKLELSNYIKKQLIITTNLTLLRLFCVDLFVELMINNKHTTTNKVFSLGILYICKTS